MLARRPFVRRRLGSHVTRFDYESIKELAIDLGRPMGTLLALAPQNDPFLAGRRGRQQGAQWFAKIWHRLLKSRNVKHLRGHHYILVSQEKPIKGIDGEPYINTERCWQKLTTASKDARYLDLVPVGDFEDHRSDEEIEYLFEHAEPAELLLNQPGLLPNKLSPPQVNWLLPSLPELTFTPAKIDQRYHVELWAEKTSANEVLVELAMRFGLNIVTAPGEISITRCYRLVERAERSGRPVRILYISDFDPAGISMPVACARKIEFFLRRDNLDLDIQVIPVVLSHEQCVRFRLPRTPLKKSEKRAKSFEEQYGEGATELDALEALRPGELRRILLAAVRRYYDTGLEDRVEAAAEHFRAQLDGVHAAVVARHRSDLAVIRRDHGELIKRCNAELSKAANRFGKAFQKIAARFNRAQQDIATELRGEAPDPDLIDWPEPKDGDEHADPLFDSKRGYVEQIDRFKRHQGKPTARKKRS